MSIGQALKGALRDRVRALGYDVRRFGPGSDSLHEIGRCLANVSRPVIFDVGAHHGQTARRFFASFPEAALYCFEPFPDSFAQLRLASKLYPTAKLEPFGFADAAGDHDFFANASSPTNSLLQLDGAAATTWGNDALNPVRKISCRFETVDGYLERNGLSRVDLLKLDVQGAEFKVLRGADRALREGKVRHIYMEIILGPTYVEQLGFGEYLRLLESYGFRVQGLFNFEYGRERELIQLDALFSRRG